MKIIKEFSVNKFSSSSPIALTIGTFDGIHLGHQAIFKKLREKATERGSTVVVTFSNHPFYVLHAKEKRAPLLTNLNLKLRLLELYKIDVTLLFAFTREFATQSFDLFLKKIRNNIPFTHLILGEGAAFGKNREGNEDQVKKLAKKMGFQVEYVSKLYRGEKVVSSSRIRNLILEGDLNSVEELLGRPLAFYFSKLDPKNISYSHPIIQLNLPSLEHLCLPPPGWYFVTLMQNGKKFSCALQISNKKNHLELYLIDSQTIDPKGEITILFHRLVKEEFCSDTEKLKEKIQHEIQIEKPKIQKVISFFSKKT